MKILQEKLMEYSKQELADLVLTLVKTYVIEGTQQFKPDTFIVNPPHYLRELSFSQLVYTLQKHISLPELSLFRIHNNDVYLVIGGREYLVSASVQNTMVNSSETQESQSGSDNRAKAQTKAPEPPKATTHVPEKKPAKSNPKDSGEVADRFKMLDLD